MTKNNNEKSLYKKLLKIQKEIKPIKKDKENPYYNAAYADINNYIEAVKSILLKQELIIIQPIIQKEDKNILKTIIIDVSNGEELESSIMLPDNLEPQKLGSAITYFGRYLLQSLLFLQAEDDLDREENKVNKKIKDVPHYDTASIPERKTMNTGENDDDQSFPF